MKGYFQKLSEDIHSLESIDQRIEEYMEVKTGNFTDSCLFQMIYLTHDGANGLSYRWKELGKFALHGDSLQMDCIAAVNTTLQEGTIDIDVHPEILAEPLVQGVFYLSEKMIESRMLDTETIYQGQLIQESLGILEGTEMKECAEKLGLKDVALQQAVGAGQIWQIGIDGMIAASELYQMSEHESLDRQRGAEILAHTVLKDRFMKKTEENELGQKLQQSMGTSCMAAENFQQELEHGDASQWLCSQSREQILDMISTIKGNQKIVQAFHKDLQVKLPTEDKNIDKALTQTQMQEEKLAAKPMGRR